MQPPHRKPLYDYSPSIEMFEKQFMSCQMIADHFKISKQTIHKFLRSHGINTAKRKRLVTCAQCGNSFLKHRCQIRHTAYQFCSPTCYFEWIKNPNYNQHRQGQRIARQVFESVVGFTFDWLIHHVDGNTDNNDISNLWAFKTQSDHMRFHRGGTSIALIGNTRRWSEVKKTPKDSFSIIPVINHPLN